MGFKILYYSVYVSLFLNYSVCMCVYVCVYVCLSAPPMLVSLCGTLIGLDRLRKVTSLPDCLDFSQRSNKWTRLKYCSVMQIYGVKIYPLYCFHDNSITAECYSFRHCRWLRAIFMHLSLSIIFFFSNIFLLTHSNLEMLSKHLKDKKQREESVTI